MHPQNGARYPYQKRVRVSNEAGQCRHAYACPDSDNLSFGVRRSKWHFGDANLHRARFAVVDLGTLEVGGRLQQGGGPLAGKDLLMLSDWSLES